MNVTIPNPKFAKGEAVQHNGNLYVIDDMRYHVDKTQELRAGDKLMGTWQYDLSLLADSNWINEYLIRYPSPDSSKYAVIDTDKYRVRKEFTTLYPALKYIMDHSRVDGWYDLELAHDGFNDIHVMDGIDCLLILNAHNGVDNAYVFDKFQYRLNGNTIRYCADYEIAYDLASAIAGVDLKHIIVN
jgi:hypothetical protein